ncbi:hypothetical protein CCHR01_09863 [Colletotrichum chrysophilum]|uniref:Uncharacterized protein n=1 Tax=Colletotrichum chrysophilum TaxID=1836956 RepID=A0AAD9AG13_9PEZI|nr:hypothetical protein CCHR01_09863 [Colletotrichum chrysophilum]
MTGWERFGGEARTAAGSWKRRGGRRVCEDLRSKRFERGSCASHLNKSTNGSVALEQRGWRTDAGDCCWKNGARPKRETAGGLVTGRWDCDGAVAVPSSQSSVFDVVRDSLIQFKMRRRRG